MTKQLSFDAPESDPVTTYFASGLTDLNPDQLAVVELVGGLISEFCSDAGVLVHQPALHTHPEDHSHLAPEEVHAKDLAKVISSDALIVLGDYASWGGGKELAWAERMRLPILILVHEGRQVSRLVQGSPADLEVHTWRFPQDLRDIWNDYFLRYKKRLEAHRRVRSERSLLWSPVQQRLLDALELVAPDGLEEIASTAQLTVRRIREIVASPLVIAEASADELQALVAALELPDSSLRPGHDPPELSPHALAALEAAARLEGWTGHRTVDLYRRASSEQAKGGTRRLRFTEPQDWIDLADHDE